MLAPTRSEVEALRPIREAPPQPVLDVGPPRRLPTWARILGVVLVASVIAFLLSR
ncbi:MAG TPA: hypothetical protein VJM84_00030 [Actinomycetota bacterium]|nr:hypothetical protein [Actinomycetota bacterium]